MRFLAAFLLALALPLSAGAQSATAIRVVELGGDGSSQATYALAGGFFKKHGLDATVTEATGGGAVIAAVAGGSAEVGFSNLVSAVAAIERGIPVMILAPSSMFTGKAPNIQLVKARGSPLRTGADLSGKIVAVTTLDGELQLGAQVWIDKNGGDSKAVHFVELPEPAMAAALTQGRIDAAMMTEPFLTRDKAAIQILGNADAAIAPQFISGVFVASKAWVETHRDTAVRVARALRETARWANRHPAETAAILAQRTGLDPAAAASMTRATFADFMTGALLQPAVDAATRYGRLKAPLDMRTIVAEARPYWGDK